MASAVQIEEAQTDRKTRLRELLDVIGLSQGQAAAYLSIMSGDVVPPQTLRRWLAVRPEGASPRDHFSRECPGWPLLLLELGVAAGELSQQQLAKEALSFVKGMTISGSAADRAELLAMREEFVRRVTPRKKGK